MTIAIFGNSMKQQTLEEVSHLLEFMQLRGVNILLSQELRAEMNLREYPLFSAETLLSAENGGWITPNGEAVDFAISVGGDGTFLSTAAAIGNKNIPILGINCGHLGFLADVQTRDVDVIMDQLIRGEYTIEQRTLLHVTLNGAGQILSPNALNEIAVLKQGLSSMITLDINVNGIELMELESDGLVIATPTGSTAYNLSVGGPLMVPQARGNLLSPIAPHSLSVRPLVIPDDWAIDIRVKSRNGNFLVSVDGRSQTLSTDTQLHIEKAPYTIKLVQLGENSFLNSLKTKMLWGAS